MCSSSFCRVRLFLFFFIAIYFSWMWSVFLWILRNEVKLNVLSNLFVKRIENGQITNKIKTNLKFNDHFGISRRRLKWEGKTLRTRNKRQDKNGILITYYIQWVKLLVGTMVSKPTIVQLCDDAIFVCVCFFLHQRNAYVCILDFATTFTSSFSSSSSSYSSEWRTTIIVLRIEVFCVYELKAWFL